MCTMPRDMHEFLCKVKTVYRGQNTNLKPLIHLNMYSNRMEISDVHHTVSAMTASMRPSLYFATTVLSTPKCQDKCTDHGSTTPEDNWIRSSYRRSCVMGKIAWPLQQVNGLIAALDLYPHASSYDMDLIISASTRPAVCMRMAWTLIGTSMGASQPAFPSNTRRYMAC